MKSILQHSFFRWIHGFLWQCFKCIYYFHEISIVIRWIVINKNLFWFASESANNGNVLLLSVSAMLRRWIFIIAKNVRFSRWIFQLKCHILMRFQANDLGNSKSCENCHTKCIWMLKCSLFSNMQYAMDQAWQNSFTAMNMWKYFRFGANKETN